MLLNGANASGKSAFLEVISLALFGESVPSRTSPLANTSKTLADLIINQQRVKRDPATTQLRLSVNGVSYVISRQFAGSSEPDPKPEKAASLYDEVNKETVAKGSKQVNNWVKSNIGSIETFLLTTMHTQHDDNNFFGLAAAQQTDIIDQLFNMRPCQLYQVAVCLEDSDLTFRMCWRRPRTGTSIC